MYEKGTQSYHDNLMATYLRLKREKQHLLTGELQAFYVCGSLDVCPEPVESSVIWDEWHVHDTVVDGEFPWSLGDRLRKAAKQVQKVLLMHNEFWLRRTIALLAEQGTTKNINDEPLVGFVNSEEEEKSKALWKGRFDRIAKLKNLLEG